MGNINFCGNRVFSLASSLIEGKVLFLVPVGAKGQPTVLAKARTKIIKVEQRKYIVYFL